VDSFLGRTFEVSHGRLGPLALAAVWALSSSGGKASRRRRHAGFIDHDVPEKHVHARNPAARGSSGKLQPLLLFFFSREMKDKICDGRRREQEIWKMQNGVSMVEMEEGTFRSDRDEKNYFETDESPLRCKKSVAASSSPRASGQCCNRHSGIYRTGDHRDWRCEK
jgi:hypothetical protein